MLVPFLAALGTVLFALGFFPPKSLATGLATEKPPLKPEFERLVLVVVDAMRSDLFFSESAQFPFVHSMIRDGFALPYTGHSLPPTVTLPRLKGLTTGSMPAFIDAILNIAESDSISIASQDSWVSQLKAAEKKIHMYGDDTWLKLFPGMFEKTDGTSSFYVADYTEVDLNVTRHLSELNSTSWDAFILHYLGLDHIGHKGGPTSPLIPAKQREMDSVIEWVWDSLDEKSLLVVLGDHGMNEVGNHGGSSPGEVSAALMLAAKTWKREGFECPLPWDPSFTYYERVPQADVVTNICLLLGLPVPKNSLGLPFKHIMTSWSESEQAQVVEYLCNHYNRLTPVKECSVKGLQQAQSTLARNSSEYNFNRIYVGIALCIVAVLVSLQRIVKLKFAWIELLIVLTVVVAYVVVMFGSSTVEEEHQFWYWGTSAILAYLLVSKGFTAPWVILVVCFRLVRGWHQAGQKWQGTPDIAGYLEQDSANLLWLLVVLKFATLIPRSKNKFTFSSLAILLCFIVKVSQTLHAEQPLPRIFSYMSVSEPWLVFLARLCIVCALFTLFSGEDPMVAMEIFLLLQTRPINIPMLLLFHIMLKALFAMKPDPGVFVLLSLFLQHSSFYAMGGSNSLATVDLSNSYTGLRSYNIPLVATLTYVSNFTGPLYWGTAAASYQGTDRYRLPFLNFFYAVSGLTVPLACFKLRAHLFTWTVFSPKLVYTVGWLVFHHLIVESGLGNIRYYLKGVLA